MTTNPFELDPTPLPRRIASGLAKIGLALKNRAWAEGTDRNLTPTQGQILVFLRVRGRPGLRLAELAEGVAITPPTASDTVTVLAKKRLVEKRRSSEDARVLEIRLTSIGKREADRASGWPDFLLNGIAALTPSEQRIFLRGIIKMIRALQERGEIPVARMCISCRFFRPNVHSNPVRPHHCAYVNAPFGDQHLRIECPDQAPAEPVIAQQNWNRFVTIEPASTKTPRPKR
jgi:DNA-binding MarR family transcriptional regulator